MCEAVSNGAPSARTTVPCRMCAEQIDHRALKCIHCESLQDWRRFLNLSSTILALLVALASVTTLLAPTLADLMEPDRSDVVLTFHGVHENLFNLVAQNRGNKDGVVATEVLHLLARSGETISFKLEPRFDQIVIPGGQTRQFTTRLNPIDFPAFLQWSKVNSAEEAKIEVRTENFGADAWEATFVLSPNDSATLNAYTTEYKSRMLPAQSPPQLPEPGPTAD